MGFDSDIKYLLLSPDYQNSDNPKGHSRRHRMNKFGRC
ncbi:hypothetical protein RintRC_5407 [Richelia intracellularis]|nr:hypothetical protein RintRC_5407 [Richelia intracellularis]